MDVAPITYDNPMGGEAKGAAAKAADKEITLAKPLAFWFGFLVLGVLVLLVFVPLAPKLGVSSAVSALDNLAKGILYLPGAIIFPLIVALWVGERIGMSGKGSHSAVSLGLFNAAYTALIYAIGIFIIFLVIYYSGTSNSLGITTHDFLLYLLALPISILILLTPTFSVMSFIRRNN